jgi:TetR/AcrR family transcriptional repressor of nem operon
MKVNREEAVANRERIVDVASRLFRSKGFGGVGVADIMKAAGLTHGGFYGHFKSKKQLEEEACDLASKRTSERWAKILNETDGDGLAALLDGYLAEERLHSSEQGCLFALLGAEAAREGNPVKRSFAAGFEALINVLTKVMPDREAKKQRARAIATFAEMVGAIVLARSVAKAEMAQEILGAARADIYRKLRV